MPTYIWYFKLGQSLWLAMKVINLNGEATLVVLLNGHEMPIYPLNNYVCAYSLGLLSALAREASFIFLPWSARYSSILQSHHLGDGKQEDQKLKDILGNHRGQSVWDTGD